MELMRFVAGVRQWINRKQRWLAWQKWAKRNNLTFMAGHIWGGAKVVGTYRSHHLSLQSCIKIYGSKPEIHTRMVLSSHNLGRTRRKKPPTVMTKDDLINLLTPEELDIALWERVKFKPRKPEISYEKPGIETDLSHLQFLADWLWAILDHYPAIIELGGRAAPYLYNLTVRDSRLKPLATQLLREIAKETTRRLGEQNSIFCCSHCLARCRKHQVSLNWRETLTYYGCRRCGESKKVLEGSAIVAVLDNRLKSALSYKNDDLCINWSLRQTLFDFDRVEIRHTTNEEVERFAMQVGNDTDVERTPYYQQMTCRITQNCDLSENSIRILKKMFGSIEWTPTLDEKFYPIPNHHIDDRADSTPEENHR